MASVIPILSFLLFIFVAITAYANYMLTGYLVFNINALSWLLHQNIAFFITVAFILSIILILQYLYFKKKITSRENCQVQFVELEKIAVDWLENEELIGNIKENLKKIDLDIEEVTKKEISETISIFFNREFGKAKPHIKKYVIDNLKFYSKEEIEIVIKIFEILEQEGNIPSVASLYKDDHDKIAYRQAVTTDGKTSYEVLSEITLFEHSIDVLDCSVEILKKNYFDNYLLLLPKMVIIALGHDIGKIENINKVQEASSIEELIFKQNPHEKVSKLILLSLFAEYEGINTIVDAISSHHAKPDSILGKVLSEADKEARDIETKRVISAANKRRGDAGSYGTRKNEIIEADVMDSAKAQSNFKLHKNTNAIAEKSENIYAILESNPDLKSEFISRIMLNINTTEILPTSGKINIISISSGKQIFFSKKFIDKSLSVCGIKTRTETEIEAALDVFRKDKLIIGKKIEINITGVAGLPNGKTESFYNINGEILGFTENELEQLKRDSNVLRNSIIKIGAYRDGEQ